MSITDTCKNTLNSICKDGNDDYGPWHCAQCFYNHTAELQRDCNPLNGNSPLAVGTEIIKNCGVSTDGCYNTLHNLCYNALRASPGNCLVCAGVHQSDLTKAGCDNNMIDWWCQQPADPNDAVICDRYLRMFVGDDNTYAECSQKAKAETAAAANKVCQGRDLGAWCRANSTDFCPDPDFCTNAKYGFKGTCEPCLNDGNPSTCGGGFPCRTTTKPAGCNRNKCHSFDCENHGGFACRIGEDAWGGVDAGQYGTWELCQQDKHCKGTPSRRAAAAPSMFNI